MEDGDDDEALLSSIYFLIKNRIPHTTTYTQLVELQVANGDEALRRHIEEGASNAQYTSKYSAVMLLEAIDEWVNKKLLESSSATFPASKQLSLPDTSIPTPFCVSPEKNYTWEFKLRIVFASSLWLAIGSIALKQMDMSKHTFSHSNVPLSSAQGKIYSHYQVHLDIRHINPCF